MKITKITLLAITAAFFVISCSKDDDPDPCTPGTFTETLLGTWDSPSLNPIVMAGEVIFNADGTGSTSSESAFDRGDTTFNWTYTESDSILLVGPYIYKMLDYECDKITLNSVVYDFDITRK